MPDVTEWAISYSWKDGDKTGWATIGTACAHPNGRISLLFHAIPVPGLAQNPGKYMLFPKNDRAKKVEVESGS